MSSEFLSEDSFFLNQPKKGFTQGKRAARLILKNNIFIPDLSKRIKIAQPRYSREILKQNDYMTINKHNE
jgi:hypothetical protein